MWGDPARQEGRRKVIPISAGREVAADQCIEGPTLRMDARSPEEGAREKTAFLAVSCWRRARV